MVPAHLWSFRILKYPAVPKNNFSLSNDAAYRQRRDYESKKPLSQIRWRLCYVHRPLPYRANLRTIYFPIFLPAAFFLINSPPFLFLLLFPLITSFSFFRLLSRGRRHPLDNLRSYSTTRHPALVALRCGGMDEIGPRERKDALPVGQAAGCIQQSTAPNLTQAKARSAASGMAARHCNWRYDQYHCSLCMIPGTSLQSGDGDLNYSYNPYERDLLYYVKVYIKADREPLSQ